MEQVLDVYKRPYDPAKPVVCMDESPKQLIRETRTPIPMSKGYEKKCEKVGFLKEVERFLNEK